jgi:hypothetical protein
MKRGKLITDGYFPIDWRSGKDVDKEANGIKDGIANAARNARTLLIAYRVSQ